MGTITNTTTAKAILEEKIANYNKALSDNAPASNVSRLEQEIKKAILDTKNAAKMEFYTTLDAENPVKDAIIKMFYEYDSCRFERDVKNGGIPVGAKLETATAVLDIVDMMDKRGLSTEWKYKVHSLAMRWTIRCASALGISGTALDDIVRNFKLSKNAEVVMKEGDKPASITSNSSCEKALQEIVDSILMVKTENDTNLYKVKKTHLSYVDYTFTQANRKDPRDVKLGNPKAMMNSMVGIMNNIVCSYEAKDEKGEFVEAQFSVTYNKRK